MKLGFLLIFLLQSTVALYPITVAAGTYPDCDPVTEDKNDADRMCYLKAAAQEVRAGVTSCDSITDAEAKKKCLLNNGLNNSSITKEEDKKKGWEWTHAAAQTAWQLATLMFFNKQKECTPYSYVLMNLGAVASGIGDLTAYFFIYRPKMNDLHEKYKDLASTTVTSEAQEKAFMYLKEEQEIKASSDNTRAIAYTVSTALYASGLVAALWELLGEKNPYTSGVYEAKNKMCIQATSGVGKFFKGELFKYLSAAMGLVPILTNSLETKKNDIKTHNNLNTILLKKELRELQDFIKSPLETTIAKTDIEESYFGSRVSSSSVVEYETIKKTDSTVFDSAAKAFNMLLDQLMISNALAQSPVTSDINPGGQQVELQDNGTSSHWNTGNSSNQNIQAPVVDNVFKVMSESQQCKVQTQEVIKLVDQSGSKEWKKNATFRAIGAGVMTGLGVMVTINAYNQAAEHKKRAEDYQTIIDMLRGLASTPGMLGCQGTDRDDISKPDCYCYKKVGDYDVPNDSRAKVEPCLSKFALTKPDDYDKTKTTSNKVCFKKDGSVDMTCKCKQQKDSSGANSCMKAQKGFDVNNSLGFMGMGDKALSAFNKLAEGDVTGANLGSGASGSYAKAANSLKRKVNDTLKKNGVAPVDFAGHEKRELASLLKSAEALNSRNGISGNSGSPLLAAIDPKLAEKLEKTAKENGTTTSDLKFNSLSAAGAGKKEAGFDMSGLGGGMDSGTESLDLAASDVMDKNFNYGANDISNNAGENLFKMISNRYLVSGLKRLFEEEKPVTPAKPENKDQKPATP